MKIKVHEIEGDYYCAIDDIVDLKLSKGMVTSAYSEVIALYAKRWLCVYFPTPHLTSKELKIVDGGVYLGRQGTPPGYADYQAKALSKGAYKITDLRAVIHHLDTTTDTPVNEITDHGDIKGFMVYALDNKEAFRDLDVLSKQKGIGRLIHSGVGVKDTGLFFIRLSYAKAYLYDYTTPDDFIMPKAEPTTPKDEAIAEQPTAETPQITTPNIIGDTMKEVKTETPPMLNEQNEYFSPYLAIAVYIWERAYINGEATETSNKLDPIIKLIEKHYPQIEADTVKKQIADIIVTKRGTSLSKVEAKPRQNKKDKK